MNAKPAGHILVMAVVHPVNLKLSSTEIILKPQGFLMKRCFRQTVCMHNPNNYFARFEWEPVIKKGMAFSINPPKGNSFFCFFHLDLMCCIMYSHISNYACELFTVLLKT